MAEYIEREAKKMRLIDADALDFSFDRRVFGEADENYVRGADDAVGVVERAPTIDPVHAAGGCYCRECGHKDSNACPAYDPPMNRTSMRIKFCNCGKRKDGEEA